MTTTQVRIHDMEVEGEEISENHGWRPKSVKEAKKQLRLGGPLIAVSLLQYSLQIVSVMFTGHLGELPLSGASLGSSFASVTGFYVLVSGFLDSCRRRNTVLGLLNNFLCNE